MDNNPQDENPFGQITEWDEFGDPAPTELPQSNPGHQSLANDLPMGHPQNVPTYPPQANVNHEGSSIGGGQWQLRTPPQGRSYGGQGQTSFSPFPPYTPLRQGRVDQNHLANPFGENIAGFSASSYGSNPQPFGQQTPQQFSQQTPQYLGQRQHQFVPGGSALGQTQFSTGPPSALSTPNNSGFGKLYAGSPDAMLPQSGNTNFSRSMFGVPQALPMLPQPQSSGVGPDRGAQHILGMLTRPAQIGARRSTLPGHGARPDAGMSTQTANIFESPTGAERVSPDRLPDDITPMRQSPSKHSGTSATPTPEAVRNHVKFIAPRSVALKWYPIDHPIQLEVVKMEKGWHSGINHFALYGDDKEPRLKYPMKLERGRRPGGVKKGPDGTQDDAYSLEHPSPETILPARLSLMNLIQRWPNHAWGQGIRLLMAEGITPQQLWFNLPECARHKSHKLRPWNYLQHVYARETDRMVYEQTGVKRVPLPRGAKREKSIDDTESQPQGSAKRRRPTLEGRITMQQAVPSPWTVPTVDNLPPLSPGRLTNEIPLRLRWLYTAPHEHTVHDLRCKLGYRRAVYLELVRRILSVTDRKFADLDADGQVQHLEHVLDYYKNKHAAHMRAEFNLPKANVLWKDDDQADCMLKVLMGSRIGRRREDETDDAYMSRLREATTRNMLVWIDNRIEEKEQQLIMLFSDQTDFGETAPEETAPEETNRSLEYSGMDLFGGETTDDFGFDEPNPFVTAGAGASVGGDADLEIQQAGEEEQEQPVQPEQEAGEYQDIE